MAYRFTNTDKWNDQWFSDLRTTAKILFIYLCDQCDIAGFLEINEKKIAFEIGSDKQGIEKALKEIEGRIIYSTDGRFVFVKNFIKHQRNFPLNGSNPAHKRIIKILEENLQNFGFQDIKEYFQWGINGVSMGHQCPLGRGRGKGDNSNKGGMGEKEKEGETQKTWREDFATYQKEVYEAYTALSNDLAYIQGRQRYHPNVDILLSLEKTYKDFWSTEAGWKTKKKSTSITLDWKATFNKALDQKWNQVFKHKNQKDETKEQPTRQYPVFRAPTE